MAKNRRFSYVASGPTDRELHGIEKAPDAGTAEATLRARGLFDIELTERRGLLDIDIAPSRVKRQEIMHLSRQLGAFVHAGLPLIDAVHTLGTESPNAALRRIMADIESGLRSGDSLSDCLDAHPKVFPEFYRGILRTAELTGELDLVLEQLARYLERDMEARRKVQSALIYPAIISVMSVLTVVVLTVYVLPKFKIFFASLHAKLPLPTRMLLAITNFIGTWWWLLALVSVAIPVCIVLLVHTPGGKYVKDRLVLRLPVVGSVIRFSLIERFCRILASMVKAGVSLPDALVVATASLQNIVFSRALADVSDSMIEGEGLAQPLARTELFPPTAAQMMRVGEDTGSLDAQLEVTARYYERELDYKLKKLTSLIEPIVIVAMGIVVGFVAIALVSAMYGVFNQVKV